MTNRNYVLGYIMGLVFGGIAIVCLANGVGLLVTLALAGGPYALCSVFVKKGK